MTKFISSKKLKQTKVLSIFDFDGTLTNFDSFISFLYSSFSKRYILKCLAQITMNSFSFLCKNPKLIHDNFKKLIIKSFLTGVDEYWFRQQAQFFCEKYWKKLIRPAGIKTAIMEMYSGAEVVICSASPELLLEPFAKKIRVNLIGTKLEVNTGKLTGFIKGHNCRGSQKTKRLEEVYGNLSNYYIRAWGDTSGDFELLLISQDPHWRNFDISYFKK